MKVGSLCIRNRMLVFITFPLSKTWKEVYCDQGYYAFQSPSTPEKISSKRMKSTTISSGSLCTSFVRCITYLKLICSSNPQEHGNNIFPSTKTIIFDSSAAPTILPSFYQHQPRSTANIEFFNDNDLVYSM